MVILEMFALLRMKAGANILYFCVNQCIMYFIVNLYLKCKLQIAI
jgi:hypothetical protein